MSTVLAGNVRGATVVIFDPLIIDRSPELPDIGPVRMPMPLTTLLGRENEIAELAALVQRSDARLVTVTGTGGVGKTRLAVEVANRLKSEFEGGRYFISLDELDVADEAVPVILGVLCHYHAPEARDISDLATALEDTPVLLLLNGAELVTGVRRDIINLLEFLPTTTALLTSRVPMRVRGEHEYPLGPLPTPREGMTLPELQQVPSVQLFMHRAMSARPSFTLDASNAADLVAVLQRLDGLPSAIELAAFRTRLFPLKSIRDRMESLLDFLSGGPQDLPQRLQNMRSVIRWGYDLMGPREQCIFRTLSVFEGAFSFEAATHVLVDEHGNRLSPLDVMDGLAQMVDHSFITPVTLVTGDAGYRMPVTTREFGRELLDQAGDSGSTQDRILEFYVAVMKANLQDIYGHAQPELLARVDFFAGNIHSALRHAREKNLRNDNALRIASMMTPYWLLRGMATEGAGLLRTFLERAQDITDKERADSYRELGSLLVEMNDIDEAHRCHTAALELYERCGHRNGVVSSWHNLGVVALKMNDLAGARDLLSAALEARRQDGRDGPLAQSLSDFADVELHEGNAEKARDLQEEAYRIHLGMGNRIGIVCDCVNLLTTALLHPQMKLDEDWYTIGSRYADDVDDRQGRAQLKLAHGMLQFQDGENVQALADISDALRVIRSSESARLMLESLPLVSEVCVRLGDDRMAAQVIGATSRLGVGSDRFGWYRGKRRAREIERGIHGRLGEGEFSRFTMLGAYQRVDQTIGGVLELLAQWIEEQAPREELKEETAIREFQPLTNREREVLELVAQGLSDRAVAEALRISSRTAMTHVANIMKKMGVHSRSAASELGIRLGLVSPPRDG